MTTPIAMGLVGAGPWAEKAYAPMLAAGPETRLTVVWARRPEAARALAERHGAAVAASFEALIDACEAIAFAVPPDVQAELAVTAARAGRHLMLDKPLALDLAGARRVVDAVETAGVATQLMLTHRYRPRTTAFLEAAHGFETTGARFAFLCGAFVSGPYATPWRRRHGALLDLGPHAFDLVEAALGPIDRIEAQGDPRQWISVICRHASGVVSDVALSGALPLERTICRFDLYGPAGVLAFDAVAGAADEPWSAARRSFAQAVRAGVPPPLDVRRGLVLQDLIDRAARAAAG